MGYSLDALSDGCYDNSSVLINKYNIRNQEQLDELEQTITSINSAQIEMETEFNEPDFEFYKSIHRELLGEIYEWAGTIRTVDMSKKGTNFCSYKKIEQQGKRIFERLKSNNYLVNLNFDSFINEIVDLYCNLNMLHPFREGNGRVQRLFITLLVRNAGHDINFSEIDTELLMIATIKSVSGDIFMLRDLFESYITKQ